jgi:preprotein translocase subunit Sec61beta
MSRRKRGSSQREGRDRRRAERPTVVSAAGLLAFYEEEEALVKIKPVHVLMATIGFIAVVVVLTMFG